MTNRADQIAIRVLAATDALFVPIRSFSGSRPSNTYVMRKAYAASGVQWRSGEMSEQGKKAAQRALESLADDGLVKTFQTKIGAKTLGVRLTDDGEEKARSLCGLPCLADGFLSVAWIAEELEREQAYWVSELSLAGVTIEQLRDDWSRYKHEFLAVENLALPALNRGWLETGCSIKGGPVWYRVTELGRARLQEGCPWEEQSDADGNPELRKLYGECFKQRLKEIGSGPKREPRELGFLPLPVSYTGKGQQSAKPISGCCHSQMNWHALGLTQEANGMASPIK